MTKKPTKKPRRYHALPGKDGTTAGQTAASAPRVDVHEAITQKIVAAIEAGAGTFAMPWHRPGLSFTTPRNASTGNPYRGTNILSLWIDAGAKKFEHQIWATYKQYTELGAQVRKGEKGSLIVKYGEWVPKSDDASDKPETDDHDDVKRLFAKAAWVFNIDQVDTPQELREKLVPLSEPRQDLTTRLDHVDDFIAATGAEFSEGGQRAFYRHRDANGDGDFIQMPPRDVFTGTATSTPTESYESTRLHELSHWAGAEHRLNRKFGERFGDKSYAFEELVAELSAAFLCAELEITNTPRTDHAQYLAHWLDVLKGDSKAIFTAASLATSSVAYLNTLQPTTEVVAAASNNPERPQAGVATAAPAVVPK